ncbi:MAG: hypothetical protein IJP92_00670 [Lachnospiraceae bacterium]|nr:hypothetical protein [Lachnospiraceae bacterium]
MTNGEFHADAIRGIIAETERNTIDRVLKIIDRHEPKDGYYGFDEYEAAYTQGKEAAIESLKEEILALKGDTE